MKSTKAFFEGDYKTLFPDDMALVRFLSECTIYCQQTLFLPATRCLSVRQGSIIVEMVGPSSQVNSIEFDIIQTPMDLPSFSEPFEVIRKFFVPNIIIFL